MSLLWLNTIYMLKNADTGWKSLHSKAAQKSITIIIEGLSIIVGI